MLQWDEKQQQKTWPVNYSTIMVQAILLQMATEAFFKALTPRQNGYQFADAKFDFIFRINMLYLT